MAKHPKSAELVGKLRTVDVRLSQGHGVPDAIRDLGASLPASQKDYVRWVKERKTENHRFQQVRQAIADLTLGLGPIVDVPYVSERRACRALGQHRSTQHEVPRGRDEEEALIANRVALAGQYGRSAGYRASDQTDFRVIDTSAAESDRLFTGTDILCASVGINIGYCWNIAFISVVCCAIYLRLSF